MIKEEVKQKLEGKIKDWHIKNPKRIYFSVGRQDLKYTADTLYDQFKMRFATASGADNVKNLEILYHFSFDKTGEIFSIRVFVDKNNPEIDSLISLFKGAIWIERELHEMLGIKFIGHPDPEHLLLKEGWPEGSYPLRKDYKDE